MATQGLFSIKGKIGLIVGLAFLCLVPFFLPRFYVYLFSVMLLYGLLATSNNLALGFGGIYQLHHAVFYGIGAYGTALMILKTGFSPWLGFVVGPWWRRSWASSWG